MIPEFAEGMLAISCAFNHEPKENCKCYSKVCVMNQMEDVAIDIQKNGCTIFKKDFVQEVVKRIQLEENSMR